MKPYEKYSYIKQEFISAKTNDERKHLVGLWIEKTMGLLGKLSGSQTPKQNQQFFKGMYKLSKGFCSKPLEGNEWCLDSEWLKVFIAIVGKDNSNIQTMFKTLKWDFEKMVNPVSDNRTALYVYSWIDGDGEVSFSLLLRSRSSFPTGSEWRVGKGVIWELQFCNDDNVEIINPDHTRTKKISKSVLLNNYKRVG